MIKNLFVLFILMCGLLLFADLEVEPDFEYNIVGPAYTGEAVDFVSDILHVTNTGSSEEFTLHLETSEIPDGWEMMWCHEYENSGCHFLIFPWSFNFLGDTVIGIDFTISYDNSPGMFDLTFFWSAAGIDDVQMNFTFRTEDFVDADNTEILPVASLGQNYPNPFNPETTITYNLAENALAELAIYNIKGELIRDFGKSSQQAGEHSVVWTGDDTNNNPVSSGMYFYRLNVAGRTYTRKLILMK